MFAAGSVSADENVSLLSRFQPEEPVIIAPAEISREHQGAAVGRKFSDKPVVLSAGSRLHHAGRRREIGGIGFTIDIGVP